LIDSFSVANDNNTNCASFGANNNATNCASFASMAAQGLGQEFLSPYLRNVGASFQHGVSFASSGSTASNSSIHGDGSESSGLFSLSVQVDQFRVFHQQSLSMYKAKKGKLITSCSYPLSLSLFALKIIAL